MDIRSHVQQDTSLFSEAVVSQVEVCIALIGRNACLYSEALEERQT
jgi:hypothetical protein